MGAKSIKGSLELGKSIRRRRNELNLTIEEVALKAGVGTKTWSRYEAGESIRKDKSKGICKALNWHSIQEDDSDASNTFDLNKYKNMRLGLHILQIISEKLLPHHSQLEVIFF